MSEKDIKIKPKDGPKVKSSPKTPAHSRNSVTDIKTAVKDIKAVATDKMVRDVIKSKVDEAKQNGQSERAEVQATESIENSVYTATDTVYHKSKSFVQNKVKQRIADNKAQEANAPKTPEHYEQAETPQEVNTPKTKENNLDADAPKDTNAPKTPERVSENKSDNTPKERTGHKQPKVKTKDSYIESQTDTKTPDAKADIQVKTKENYIKAHSADVDVKDGIRQKNQAVHSPKTKNNVVGEDMNVIPKSSEQARKEYVTKKVKTKAEYEKRQAVENTGIKNDITHTETYSVKASDKKKQPDNLPKDKKLMSVDNKEVNAPKTPDSVVKDAEALKPNTQNSTVKTKQNYMRNLRAERLETIQPSYQKAPAPKSKVQKVSRSTANKSKAVKVKQGGSKLQKAVKSGNVYKSASTARKTAQKTKKAKQAAKTQKEVAKKAAKEAAKQAKIVAQKAAQVAKATAKVVARVAVKVAQMVAAAATKLVSALVAAGGWAVLLVVLIIVIIVAAIAASPFGIFISDEAADAGSIPVSSIVNECNIELSARLTEIEDTTPHDRIVMEGEQADWGLVLSLFSVKVAGVEDDTVQDVVVIDDAKKAKLKEVFWDMHTITSRTETVTSGDTSEVVLYITITAKTKDEMITEYGFTPKQKEALETLLENADGYIGTTQSLAISDATAQEVIDNLPDGLSDERKQVVKKACSLVGKLTYFWGGKSSAIGWDSEWGKMKLVTAEGSRSTGCMRPFGLDCSGFVTWSFINAGFNASDIGHGTSGQIAKCTRISLSSAQPGDLAFFDDISHVGIVGGRDASGNVLVIHCSSGANNVVITTGGFGFGARPSCY